MNYLKRIIKYIVNILITILILVGVYYGSFYATELRYNDKKITEYETLKTENKRLKKQIKELKKELNINIEGYDYIISKVIIRDIHEFYKEIVIDKGKKDGLKKGQAILNNEGMIGIIDKVEKNQSVVKLLSSDYNVSVSINDTYGNLSSGKVTLLDKYSEIKEGDKVYTSGLATIPKGLYIGKVSNIKNDSQNIGKEASVNLINNTNLNYVVVIKGAI